MAIWLWLKRNSFSNTLSRLLSGEHHGPHVFADLERFVARRMQAQQILREQDAENLIAILTDHRETGVTRLDHQRHELIGRRIALDEHHLRARHHDVAHLHVGHRQNALEHDQCIAVEQTALARLSQILDQFGEITRLAGHRLRDASEPAAGAPCVLIGHDRRILDQWYGFEKPSRSRI